MPSASDHGSTTVVLVKSNVGRGVADGVRLDTVCTMESKPSRLNRCMGPSSRHRDLTRFQHARHLLEHVRFGETAIVIHVQIRREVLVFAQIHERLEGDALNFLLDARRDSSTAVK